MLLYPLFPLSCPHLATYLHNKIHATYSAFWGPPPPPISYVICVHAPLTIGDQKATTFCGRPIWKFYFGPVLLTAFRGDDRAAAVLPAAPVVVVVVPRRQLILRFGLRVSIVVVASASHQLSAPPATWKWGERRLVVVVFAQENCVARRHAEAWGSIQFSFNRIFNGLFKGGLRVLWDTL